MLRVKITSKSGKSEIREWDEQFATLSGPDWLCKNGTERVEILSYIPGVPPTDEVIKVLQLVKG